MESAFARTGYVSDLLGHKDQATVSAYENGWNGG
jgi:integrase